MSQPTIRRPATRADFDQLIDEQLPYRVRAWALEHDGKLVAVGGFAYQPGDVIAAFVLKASGAEKYPLSLHRAGKMAMTEAKRLGFRRVVALAEKNNPAAEPWLARFGFKPLMIDDVTTWVWTA